MVRELPTRPGRASSFTSPPPLCLPERRYAAHVAAGCGPGSLRTQGVSPTAAVCVCSDYFTVNDDGELCLLPGRQGLREVLTFSDPGTFQFAKATYPWLARVRVRVQAAGGGSAGANAADNELVARPGGAGGGYSESVIEAAALGAVETIVVGAGGAAGGTASDGGTGGGSSFGGLVTANGGQGGSANMTSGVSSVTAAGIPAPLAGTGQIIMGGGGGGGAIRLTSFQGLSGSGGESFLGHGGFERGSSGAGSAPRGFGGGAGGAFARDGATEPGTDGGRGLVVVELYG